jgi:hypothetical protein
MKEITRKICAVKAVNKPVYAIIYAPAMIRSFVATSATSDTMRQRKQKTA